MFRLAQDQPSACKSPPGSLQDQLFPCSQLTSDPDTDFLEAGGPNGYAWNLVRSESDDLLFRHAGNCGAHIFDEIKVDAIEFEDGPPGDGRRVNGNGRADQRRPVSATWFGKDGASGSIAFKYLVDASGRNGLVSTRYLKNRTFNENFKNIANWAYWKSDNIYGTGTHMEGSPYFEALDGKGQNSMFASRYCCHY